MRPFVWFFDGNGRFGGCLVSMDGQVLGGMGGGGVRWVGESELFGEGAGRGC